MAIAVLGYTGNSSGGGSTPAGATLMPSGQTTVYRTGDDADKRLVNGRTPDFFTLATNNPFGNTNRFTDELGGSTCANDIYIDWSTYDRVAGTVLGYYFTGLSFGNFNWNDAIDNAISHSVASYTSGWRLPNIDEALSLFNQEQAHKLDYPPFNFNTSITSYTSTTSKRNTATAYLFATFQSYLATEYTKTNSRQTYLYCRTFTVTGTTLT
jgi:hypothetical protein